MYFLRLSSSMPVIMLYKVAASVRLSPDGTADDRHIRLHRCVVIYPKTLGFPINPAIREELAFTVFIKL